MDGREITGSRRQYPLSDGGAVVAPNYERVARSLSDEELEDEILAGRGEANYQLALLAEMERRGEEE